MNILTDLPQTELEARQFITVDNWRGKTITTEMRFKYFLWLNWIAILQGIRKAKRGYVYLMQHGDEYKIGLSKNPTKRVSEIGNNFHKKVELIHTISTCDMRSLESALHSTFIDKRLGREWFSLEIPDVEFIKSLVE